MFKAEENRRVQLGHDLVSAKRGEKLEAAARALLTVLLEREPTAEELARAVGVG